jgi:hypothetical protein
LGVNPRRARLAVLAGAERISKSNSACHTRLASASVAELVMFLEPMRSANQ